MNYGISQTTSLVADQKGNTGLDRTSAHPLLFNTRNMDISFGNGKSIHSVALNSHIVATTLATRIHLYGKQYLQVVKILHWYTSHI